ncbi:MAG: radical SAM protein [Planctomycetes bacterium]|nr:radical SAM protein [Planctomycetota bacterium]
MITYDPPVWRPPSEANSLILQVTLGCSFNRCSFCSMYRTKEFRVRELVDVLDEIDLMAVGAPQIRRVFLADGDALVAPTDHLIEVLDRLYARFPDLQRVSSYALPVNFLQKTDAELVRLREAGLKLLFYGIESGSREIMRRITKGATPQIMIEGITRARAADMKVSATVVLGLGGTTHWKDHIDGTVHLVNQVPLNFLSTLQLGLDSSVEAEFMHKFREPFTWQDDAGLLREQRRLVSGIDPPRPVIFRSNHASNALPLKGTLPKDRDRIVATLDAALDGDVPLVPPQWRAY